MIKQSYHIHATPEQVWQALVDPKIIEQWSGSPAVMDDQVGTKFSLWDGDMYGTNTEVIAHKKLAQDWYGGKWDKPSKVTFTLRMGDHGVDLELIHTNLPDGTQDDFAAGWKDYYLGEIQQMLEHSHG